MHGVHDGFADSPSCRWGPSEWNRAVVVRCRETLTFVAGIRDVDVEQTTTDGQSLVRPRQLAVEQIGSERGRVAAECTADVRTGCHPDAAGSDLDIERRGSRPGPVRVRQRGVDERCRSGSAHGADEPSCPPPRPVSWTSPTASSSGPIGWSSTDSGRVSMSEPMTSSRSASSAVVDTARASTRVVAGAAWPVTARSRSASVVDAGAATMSMSASPWGVRTTTSIAPRLERRRPAERYL